MSDKDSTAAAAAQEGPADKAMKLKQDAPAPQHPASGQTADTGMTDTPDTGIAPSGAFGAEGQRPVLERSRKVR